MRGACSRGRGRRRRDAANPRQELPPAVIQSTHAAGELIGGGGTLMRSDHNRGSRRRTPTAPDVNKSAGVLGGENGPWLR